MQIFAYVEISQYFYHMEDRIKIGDVWYVREGMPVAGGELSENEVVFYRGAVYEGSSFCFDFSRLAKPGLEEFDEDFVIEFIDKSNTHRDDWEEHFIDNYEFIVGIENSKEECLEELRSLMSEEQIKEFRKFLGLIRKTNW